MEYIGFTKDKEMLELFLEQRKNKKFIIEKVKDKKIAKQGRKDIFDYTKELCYLAHGDDEIVGFVFEENDINTFILELLLQTRMSLESLYFINEKMKFTEEEKVIVTKFIYTLEEIVNLLMMEEDFAIDYTHLIDLKKIVQDCQWEIYPTC